MGIKNRQPFLIFLSTSLQKLHDSSRSKPFYIQDSDSTQLSGTPDGISVNRTMLKSAPADSLTNHEDTSLNPPPTFPVYYFFYGTLTDPQQLKWILDLPLEEELHLWKSQVVGYATAKWGDYPALINGESGQVVSGYSYLVQSEEQVQKLAYYETKAYESRECWIFFMDDEAPGEVEGKTFMYAGDAKALLEKRFDRKLWERQMGEKLG